MTVNECENVLSVKLITDDYGAKKVVICPEDLALKPGNICWYKDPESPNDFTFEKLVISEQTFEIIEQDEDRICVRHDAHPAIYTYTLVVTTHNGEVYDTLQPVCDERFGFALCSIRGDKPVIRPK